MFFTLKVGVRRVIFSEKSETLALKLKKTVYRTLFCLIRLSSPHVSLSSLSHNSHYATQRTTVIPAFWSEGHVHKFSIGDLKDTNKRWPQQQAFDAPVLNVEV